MASLSIRTQRSVAALTGAMLIALTMLIVLRFRRRAGTENDDQARGEAQAAPRTEDVAAGEANVAREAAGEQRLDDALVAREAAAAAAAAASIGGTVRHDVEDPAMAPVYEAGGGEQDGFEAAESELIENATHGDGSGDPLRDAITPEVESDASQAVYGEADRIPSTEVVEDPGTGEDDPGRGPGLAAERGPGLQPPHEL
jgi:hypothetical protein